MEEQEGKLEREGGEKLHISGHKLYQVLYLSKKQNWMVEDVEASFSYTERKIFITSKVPMAV